MGSRLDHVFSAWEVIRTGRFMITKSIALLFVGLFLNSCATSPAPEVAKSDVLWNIVSTQCVPFFLANQLPKPCLEVNIFADHGSGYVVLKDKVGDLQYLLMPTQRISGIESPEILTDEAPNYFYLAWKANVYMESKRGSPIPVEAMSLAVNSQYGRSQNHLHVHISCPKPAVQTQVQKAVSLIKKEWSLLPFQILNHRYYARKLSEQELSQQNAFKSLAAGVPEARDHMGEFGLAMVAVQEKKKTVLVLLASRLDRSGDNWGSVEEIQDHSCPQLTSAK